MICDLRDCSTLVIAMIFLNASNNLTNDRKMFLAGTRSQIVRYDRTVRMRRSANRRDRCAAGWSIQAASFLFTFHEFIAYVDVSRRSFDSCARAVAF